MNDAMVARRVASIGASLAVASAPLAMIVASYGLCYLERCGRSRATWWAETRSTRIRSTRPLPTKARWSVRVQRAFPVSIGTTRVGNMVFSSHPSCDVLSALASSELPEDAAAEVRRHIQVCLECRESLQRIEASVETSPSAVRLTQHGNAPGSSSSSMVEWRWIGRYQVLAKLDEGGMGAVYKAWDLDLGKFRTPDIPLFLRGFRAAGPAGRPERMSECRE